MNSLTFFGLIFSFIKVILEVFNSKIQFMEKPTEKRRNNRALDEKRKPEPEGNKTEKNKTWDPDKSPASKVDKK